MYGHFFSKRPKMFTMCCPPPTNYTLTIANSTSQTIVYSGRVVFVPPSRLIKPIVAWHIMDIPEYFTSNRGPVNSFGDQNGFVCECPTCDQANKSIKPVNRQVKPVSYSITSWSKLVFSYNGVTVISSQQTNIPFGNKPVCVCGRFLIPCYSLAHACNFHYPRKS